MASTLSNDDILRLPEIEVEIPVDELYENADFGGSSDNAG